MRTEDLSDLYRVVCYSLFRSGVIDSPITSESWRSRGIQRALSYLRYRNRIDIQEVQLYGEKRHLTAT